MIIEFLKTIDKSRNIFLDMTRGGKATPGRLDHFTSTFMSEYQLAKVP